MKLVSYTSDVGSLMYVMVMTQPDIVHVVGVVSIFMHFLSQQHLNTVKHIFRYLIDIEDFGIHFRPNEPLGLVDYTNLNFVDCLNSRKSTSSYLFLIQHVTISWRSNLQEGTATSTIEAEYVDASKAAKEALRFGQLACTFGQVNLNSASVIFIMP